MASPKADSRSIGNSLRHIDNGAAIKKLIVLAAFVCFVSRVGDTADDFHKEVLNFKIGNYWKVAAHSDTDKGHAITYIRQGDDINH
jgi:hypothetical protein